MKTAPPFSSKPPSPPEDSAPAAPKRMRRSADLFDAEGNPVQITLTCLCCKEVKPLTAFGLRKMSNGSIRNQPWCRGCRSSKSAEVKAAAAAAKKGRALKDGALKDNAPKGSALPHAPEDSAPSGASS